MTSRPKTSVFIAMSLDGYIAGENDDLAWLDAVNAEGEDYGFHAFFDSVDLLVMGRRTYDVVSAMSTPWPYGDKRLVVLTSRPAIARHGEEFREGAPADLLREFQDEGVRHIYLDGGRVIGSFLEAGLVDELTISIIPVLLGGGVPLFAADRFPERKLRLLSSQAFDSGLVQLTYALESP